MALRMLDLLLFSVFMIVCYQHLLEFVDNFYKYREFPSPRQLVTMKDNVNCCDRCKKVTFEKEMATHVQSVIRRLH